MFNRNNIQIENLTIDKVIKYNERVLYQCGLDSQHESNDKHDAMQGVIRECLTKLRKIRDAK